MEAELRTLERLLRAYKYYAQANAIEDMLELRAAGDEAGFRREVLGATIWGGAGSVADANLRVEAGPEHPMAADDARAHDAAMVALADALEAAGLGTPRTRQVAATFRDWLKAGI
jgi:hypothetical protein